MKPLRPACRLLSCLVWGSMAPLLAAPGDLDTTLVVKSAGESDSVVMQPDGNVVVVGDFSGMGGATRAHIARLTPDALDGGFNPGANAFVRNVGVLPDGKLLFTGLFSRLAGTPRNCLARTLANGAIDTSFNPNFGESPYGIALQPDGKVLVGGSFTAMGDTVTLRLARLHANGALDTSFQAPADDTVRTIRMLDDGRMLVSGAFTTIGGTPCLRVARLFPDGKVDPSFAATVDGVVTAMALQADGRILIVGYFNAVGGKARAKIARLMPNGELDDSFLASADDTVWCVLVQADGKIVVVGNFHTVNGQSRSRLARLLPSGALDPTFTATAVSGGLVYGATLQGDGKLWLSGLFSTVGGVSRPGLARLQNDAATESLTVINPSRVEWLRGGTAPETHEVTFEWAASASGPWNAMNVATRMAGGWVGGGATLPASGLVRARARIMCGLGSACFGLMEKVATYSFSAQQQWRYDHFGTVANSGDAADSADPDGDGLVNLVEYAFGLPPEEPGREGMPAWQKVGDTYVLSISRPEGVNGLTYSAEYSTRMEPGTWAALPNRGTEANPKFVVQAAASQAYFRMRISVP